MQKNKLAVQLCAVLAVTSPMFALGQNASTGALEEVVVTAQRRAQSQQDVPIAITTVTAEDIERIGATNIKEIQFSTPNLVVSGTNPVQQSFGIRGISDRGRNPGYDQRIGVYVDGVWVGKSAASNQAALDIQAVEILRGPQGTLFGKNTVAGAINISTIRPDDELGGYLQAEIGNYNLRRVRGAVNVPITDSVKGRVSFSSDVRDGYIDNLAEGVGEREYNDKNEQAVRAALEWDVSDQTEVFISFDHMENDYNDILAGEYIGDPVAPKIREVNVNGAGALGVEGVGGGSVQISHTFDSGFELTSISAYRYEDWFYSDNDEDYAPTFLANSSTSVDSDHVTQEFRLASPENDKFDYVVGLYYVDQDIDGDGPALLNLAALTAGAVPIPVYELGYQAAVNVESWAAFVHANYQLTETLQLTAGLRYTEEEKSIDFTISDPFKVFFDNGSTTDSRKSDDWSPKASLNWFINDDVMAYASYARSFKSGGFNADFIADLSGLEFDDEQVDAFEFGLKSTLLDGRMRLNIAVFESNHTDFQVQAQTPVAGGGSILTVSNAGELTSRGFEADLQWLVNDSLRLWGSYGYTDAEFDEFDGCAIGGGVGSCAGKRPPEAPENSYNIGGEITFPVTNGEVFANANYFWRSDMYSNPNNEASFLNEEHSELGARIGWNSASGNWSVFAWGRNLTDEETQIHNSVSFLGIPRAVYNEPRMMGLAVRWNMGPQ